MKYKGKFYIVSDSEFIPKILKEFHDGYVGGHSGIDRTITRISINFWWKNMVKDIRHYVRNYVICQKIKSINQRQGGLLMPMPIPPSVWHDLSVDFITSLPKVQNKSVIIVVVDRLSKGCHLGALPANYNASMVAEFFVKEIIRLHGYPNSIVSDRDKVFTSRFWKELNKLSGTKLNFTSAFHPQSDGQTEVVNRGIEMYLRALTHEDSKKWLQLLPWAEFWFNTNFNASTGQTPFKILFGKDPPMLPQFIPSDSTIEAVEGNLQVRIEAIDAVKLNLSKAQARMKKLADRNRKEIEFEEGNLVLVKLQPYRQLSIATRLHNKLSFKFFGPFKIKKKNQ